LSRAYVYYFGLFDYVSIDYIYFDHTIKEAPRGL
jgi:hypothetical protein